MKQNSASKIVVALDYENKQQALSFVDKLTADSCKLKVGKEMFTHFGPDFVATLVNKGFDVFLDLKFHDIPNTVAKAVKAAADLGVWMVNVHAVGGSKMMSAAKQSLNDFGEDAPLLIAVTVLTSMDESDLKGVGVDRSAQEQVMMLAQLTFDAGLEGVVCSSQEAVALKSRFGQEFKLITPGIRPIGSAAGDQKRVVTPLQAVQNGSDYLVIGRPVTQADDPLAVLNQINASLKQ
ncbi:MAG: orotidine-5'-phosphate decarboxylase [Psychrosphaera sp.]|nr:orotidine-5'-phosphate decarboxylase [Psychrosphaera sp.]